MKFASSLQFNAVPEWKESYISYDNLKKLIYRLERQSLPPAGIHLPDVESPLLQPVDEPDPDEVFTDALDSELEKVVLFYGEKEKTTFEDVERLLARLNPDDPSNHHHRPAHPPPHPARVDSNRDDGSDDDDKNDDDGRDEQHRLIGQTAGPSRLGRSATDDTNRRRRRQSSVSVGFGFRFGPDGPVEADGEMIRYELSQAYVTLAELRSFVQLNSTGFRKVLKKYDKTLDRSLKDDYLRQRVQKAHPFLPATAANLEQHRVAVTQAYAAVATDGDLDTAKEMLRMKLREYVTWERNTVWRDLIGIERRTQAAGVAADLEGHQARLQGDEAAPSKKVIATPFGPLAVPAWAAAAPVATLAVILSIFALLLVVPVLDDPAEQNCLAMVVFVSLLWATEAIPLFVTALLVPLLTVVLRLVRDEQTGARLRPSEAGRFIFAAMWTPVIILLLGGFTVAAALSKHNIARRLATIVLSRAGGRPETVLLATMFVAAFASMWISNVAAPVLCYSLIQPILRTLPPESGMAKALVLGVALASNVGGMGSPIASPQNLIALENMNPVPGWGLWFVIVLPVGVLSILAAWLLLVISFRPGRGPAVKAIRPVREPFSTVHWFVSIVTVATIVLWIFSHQVAPVFGDMGVIALIPMILFFGTGVLTKEDFNNFLWTIIMLAAGGLALGKAVSSSGLLVTVARGMMGHVEGLSLYWLTGLLSGIMLVVATFISHTVAALIFLPLVQQVGMAIEDPHPNLLVMAGVLMCSTAMGLPTSGFPNMTAIMKEDDRTGQRYLKVRHFLTRGVPASLLSYVIMMTVGYSLMRLVGF